MVVNGLSQVYFHLGEYDEALSFALGAGKLFDLSAKTLFVETIMGRIFLCDANVAKCVDRYIAVQNQLEGDSEDHPSLDMEGPVYEDDHRLTAVVDRMFDRCIEDREYKQVSLYNRNL